MELSIRLKTVAQAVTPGNRVADVGTDHGYVPIYLVKNNLSPGGIALDVNKGPLEKAKEHIREEKLGSKIATRLGNGLVPIEPEETDTVVIAGMGGNLICKILKAKPEFLTSGKEFILQPQSEWFKVRKLLREYQYGIEKEWFLKEDGKYYVIIKAQPSERLQEEPASSQSVISQEFQSAVGKTIDESEAEKIEKAEKAEMESIYDQYGQYLIKTKNPVLKEYLEKEISKKEMIAANLKQSTDSTAVETISDKEKENVIQRENRYQQLYKEIEDMKKAIL